MLLFFKRFSLASIFIIIYSLSASASEKHSQKSGKGFNAGELIIGHITDNHSWHIAGEGHHAISIPLPVIIYSKERGLDVFSSGHFEHGHKTYKGYMQKGAGIVAVNETGHADAHAATINEELTKNLWDVSITKNVASLLLSVLLMTWIFISVAKSYTTNRDKAPKGMQSLIEPIILFVRDDVAKPSIGEKKYEKHMPYLLTVFFFIWINNLLGLIPFFPGGANLTGNVAVTMTLAIFTFIITLFSSNKNYWRHIFAMPGVPKWVLTILTPIEIFGIFLRPVILMVRLFANMAAGHIIVLSFFSLIFIFGEMNAGLGLGVSVVSLAFTVFMTALELLVAFLQAYVFTLLSAMYFGAASEEHNHHADPLHAHRNEHIEEAALI